MKKQILLVLFLLLVAGNGLYLFIRYQKTFAEDAISHNPQFMRIIDETTGMVQTKVLRDIATDLFSHTIDDSMRRTFDNFYSDIKSPSYFRMKVWNRSYQIIWSNLSELIGKKFTDNKELTQSYDGSVSTEYTIDSKGGSTKAELLTEYVFNNYIEIYVPIKDANGKVAAVVEVYQSIDPIIVSMKNALYTQALVVISISVVLYITAALILNRKKV